MNFPKLHVKDFVAVLLIIGIFGLIIVKANHSLDAILTLIIGYYFGHRQSGIDTGKSNFE